MGYDYYVIKCLKIVYLNKDEQIIELYRYGLYFPEYDDSDCDSDDENYNYMIYKKYLKVNFTPRVLYTKINGWVSTKVENKYIDKITHYSLGIHMKDVKEIIKFEIKKLV